MVERVFEIFNELTAIPRGSGNMKKIADYCVDFAVKNNLKYLRDESNNIIIFKDATANHSSNNPVILQGHLDMVCQKTEDNSIDFEVSAPKIIIDGDFIKADRTTLGADNGIAVAMIMAILESDTISHPPIEAVFTTDEEIGMVGAVALDTSPLKGKRLINLDSEEDDTITVSCAGGSEFKINLLVERNKFFGKQISLKLFGLLGGHSGVDIDKNRENANILTGGLLEFLDKKVDFQIAKICGGDKSNAITTLCKTDLVSEDTESLVKYANQYLQSIKENIVGNEPDFNYSITVGEDEEYLVFSKNTKKSIIYLLNTIKNGVLAMSSEIQGLVETSLNLGVLETKDDKVVLNYALRSNKRASLKQLEYDLTEIANTVNTEVEISGYYPPWEFKQNSSLLKLYVKCFNEYYGFNPKIEAIHAGLECGVFDSKIEGLSAIAVGPQMYDVHTVNERLSISSTSKFFVLLVKVLNEL